VADQSDSLEQEGTPEADAGTDWQKRYTDLQAEYTKTSQEASELRQYQELVNALSSDDPQLAAQAADALGLSFVGEEDDAEPAMADPMSALEQRLAGIEQYLGTRTEQETLQEMQSQDADYIDAALTGLETRIGRELTQPEVELLVSHSLVNRTNDGHPGIESAISLYDEVDSTAQDRWVRTKRVSTPSVGQEGQEQEPGLPSHAERVANMVEKFQANQ
jgi:hypothetical protein